MEMRNESSCKILSVNGELTSSCNKQKNDQHIILETMMRGKWSS